VVIAKKSTGYKETRCFKCGKLLAKQKFGQDSLEIKCIRCGALNLIFKDLKDQVIITDVNGTILYANSLVESVTGYSMREIIGQKPSLWGNQMSQVFYKKMWRMIKLKKQPVVVKLTNKKKDGTLYDAILRISPVFDTAGDIHMFVGMETLIN
jgi:PAS domain S-box-containing protein